MAGFVTLDCPSCGGTLYLLPDATRYTRIHCGKKHQVGQAGAGETAWEAAGSRLDGEIADLERRRAEAAARLEDVRQSPPQAPGRGSTATTAFGVIALAGLGWFLSDLPACGRRWPLGT